MLDTKILYVYNIIVVLNGELVVPCNLRSTIAGLTAALDICYGRLHHASDVDNKVLSNENL